MYFASTFSDKKFILPEYKIDLLNKNKKIIKKIEYISNIEKAPLKNKISFLQEL